LESTADSVDNIFVVVMALLTYGSAVWGAFRFFCVDDSRSQRGKQLISSVGGLAMLGSIALLATANLSAANFVIGSLAFVFSLGAFWWTYWSVRRYRFAFAFSSCAPTAIVQVGPYAYVRHPFYVAYLLGWFATFAVSPGLASGGIFLLMAIIYFSAASVEEAAIATSPHAAEYASYKARVGMFIPFRFGK